MSLISLAKEYKAHAPCKMKLDKDCLQGIGKSAISCTSPQQSCEYPANGWQHVLLQFF